MSQNMNQMVIQDKEGETLGSFEVVDSVAREAIGNFPIKKIVSESADTGPVLRSLDSGSYVLHGKFRAYNGATGVLSFSSALMVNIIKSSSKSSVQIFYPVNNCIQFLEITDDALVRTNVYLNQILENNIPKIGEVTLTADGWVGEGSLFSQVVTIEGVTENSQVDLTPSVEQLAVFYEKDLTFVTENEGGVVTVYAIGQKPLNDYVIQVTITEVGV